MKKIEDFIDYLECPYVNGIIFPDGKIQLLDVKANWESPINYTISIGTKTSIDILSKKGELWWNSCTILVKSINLKHSIEIIAGEGNYGSDGFIGVIDFNSKKVIWLAFFNCSNPFGEIKVINEEIYVRSTIGCVWKFNIKNPMNCVVECIDGSG